MAKNWTLKEAVKVITAGKNKEALQELGKRYPVTALTIAKLETNEALEKLMSVMPDHVTMLKLERAFKDGAVDTDDEMDDEDVTEGEDDEEVDGDQDLSEMTSKQLYALCVKKGIKAKKYGVNKQYYLDLLNGTGGDDADGEDVEDGVEDAEDAEDTDDVVDYSKMKAPELYSLCKKRKIKVEPRQKAAVYIKALEAADADVEADDEGEDWDEEEAPKNEKKKTEKKQAAKSSKKKAATEDDDEEDWDI